MKATLCDPCIRFGVVTAATTRTGYSGGPKLDLCAHHKGYAVRMDRNAVAEAVYEAGAAGVKALAGGAQFVLRGPQSNPAECSVCRGAHGAETVHSAE